MICFSDIVTVYLQYHCWKCGDVFCTRCIDRLMPLPGHMTQTPVPVCKACYKELKSSPTSSIQVRTPVSVPTK